MPWVLGLDGIYREYDERSGQQNFQAQYQQAAATNQWYVNNSFLNSLQALQGWQSSQQNAFPEYPQVILQRPRPQYVADDTEDEMAGKGFTGMINTFMVGCDPEFVALDARDQQISMSRFFGGNGEIGFDHGGRVGEFRPAPTRGTYALVKKLHRLINSREIANINANKLRAGAVFGRDTLGGHVHFGFSVPQMEHASGTRQMPVQIRALDRVTAVLENLDILPQVESSKRRHDSQYGRFSDIRDSSGHLEYRTMASWLYDPRVAYLCLTAAKLAASDPEGTLETLPTSSAFNILCTWFGRYKTKDINAKRAIEKVLDKSIQDVQVYPDVNFRERWVTLGL